LDAIQKLGAIQKRSSKVSVIEHRLEKVRAFQASGRQVRPGQVRPAEICAPKIHSRKIEPAQIETSQTGLGQIWRLAVFRPPFIPRRGTTSKHRYVLIVWHAPPPFKPSGSVVPLLQCAWSS